MRQARRVRLATRDHKAQLARQALRVFRVTLAQLALQEQQAIPDLKAQLVKQVRQAFKVMSVQQAILAQLALQETLAHKVQQAILALRDCRALRALQVIPVHRVTLAQ